MRTLLKRWWFFVPKLDSEGRAMRSLLCASTRIGLAPCGSRTRT